MFSDDPELTALAVRFCVVVTVGSPFLFQQINAEKTLQATGNMLQPMIFNSIGAIINIILNPILIFGLFGAPAMGIAGSAMSTVIAQFIAMSVGMAMLLKGGHAVKISLRHFRPKKKTVSDIYAVGFPSIIMQAIMSVTLSGLNKILIGLTPTAVAVLGAYFRIQSLIFMPVFGLNQGALPIMGYNFGARDKSRLMDGYKKASVVAVAIMVAGTAAFQIFPRQILMAFDASDAMIHIGVRALRIISICFIPAGFSIVSSTMFQALGHGFLSMFISLLRQMILVLPLTYFLAWRFGVDYVWFSYPMAEMLALAVMVAFVKHIYNKEIKNL
jgi:putative MATE family efflux protein